MDSREVVVFLISEVFAGAAVRLTLSDFEMIRRFKMPERE